MQDGDRTKDEVALGGGGGSTADTSAVQAEDAVCQHKFSGWREHEDGLGGETVCERCGIGAMAYTLSLDI